MKRVILFILLLPIFVGCVDNTIDSQQQNHTESYDFHLFETKSTSELSYQDSLNIQSKIQSDVRNILMNQIILKDSTFVLALSKKDALDIGVSESLYDSFIDYVQRLNEQMRDYNINVTMVEQ